jgi:hypothetical protein
MSPTNESDSSPFQNLQKFTNWDDAVSELKKVFTTTWDVDDGDEGLLYHLEVPDKYEFKLPTCTFPSCVCPHDMQTQVEDLLETKSKRIVLVDNVDLARYSYSTCNYCPNQQSKIYFYCRTCRADMCSSCYEEATQLNTLKSTKDTQDNQPINQQDNQPSNQQDDQASNQDKQDDRASNQDKQDDQASNQDKQDDQTSNQDKQDDQASNQDKQDDQASNQDKQDDQASNQQDDQASNQQDVQLCGQASKQQDDQPTRKKPRQDQEKEQQERQAKPSHACLAHNLEERCLPEEQRSCDVCHETTKGTWYKQGDFDMCLVCAKMDENQALLTQMTLVGMPSSGLYPTFGSLLDWVVLCSSRASCYSEGSILVNANPNAKLFGSFAVRIIDGHGRVGLTLVEMTLEDLLASIEKHQAVFDSLPDKQKRYQYKDPIVRFAFLDLGVKVDFG